MKIKEAASQIPAKAAFLLERVYMNEGMVEKVRCVSNLSKEL